MPVRDWRLRIEDMIEAIERIEEYVCGMGADAFYRDQRTCDAVVRNLEIIGEAARHVPDEIAQRHPAVAWRKAREMRNVLIHEYSGVDLAIVWKTIHEDLPPLKAQLRKVLEAAGEE